MCRYMKRYEQRTKPLHPRKDVAKMIIVFCVSLIVPEDLMCVILCSKIRQTCVSKVIVFCVTHIVPESFMTVSSIKYQCPGGTVPKCRRFWRAPTSILYILSSSSSSLCVTRGRSLPDILATGSLVTGRSGLCIKYKITSTTWATTSYK